MTDTDLRVSTTSPSQWGRVLSIEVPRARYDAARAEVMRDLRRRLVRPGFRKGHVPAAIVEREFAQSIDSSTLEKFLPDVCEQAISREELEPISSPQVRNLVLDDPQVVRVEVAIDVRPTISIESVDGLRGNRWTLELSDDHIKRAVDEIREEHAQFDTVEREARDGDHVQVSYAPLDDQGNEIVAKRVENYPFRVGGDDGIKEFSEAVRGRRAGDTVRAQIQYPAEYGDAEFAGKTVAFALTLGAVKEKRLPEADDDLARTLGLDDFATLQSRVRSDLERRVRDESERAVKRALVLESLARQHGLQVTEEEVDSWIEEKVQATGSGGSGIRQFFSDARRRRRLRAELTDDKVFDFLKGKAEITEAPRPAA